MKQRIGRSAAPYLLSVVCTGIAWNQTADSRDRFTLALTGDCIITRRLSVYEEPEYLRMIDLIRSADAAFTNLEILFHDYEPFPMHQSGGTYMRAEPVLARELVWAGFDMVSRANNHAGDYGVLGMQLTTRHTEAAGLVHAGVGRSLAAAREAKFLETGGGRVALISCASTYPDHARAGRTRGDIPPRPGLNPLRYTSDSILPEDRYEPLRSIVRDIGVRHTEKDDTLRVFGHRFIRGESLAVQTAPSPEDLEEISSVVRNASRLADITVVSVHAHESKGDRSVPADFITAFSRAVIDAGADVVVGHGSHVLRGIEIYRGKPILYSLGNFVFQNETLLRLPPENYERYGLGNEFHVADFNDARYDHDRTGFPSKPEYWESVVAVPEWEGETLVSLKLYPIVLGYGEPRTARGRPRLAEDAPGRKIIGDLKRLSEPLGTLIEYRRNFGEVVLRNHDID